MNIGICGSAGQWRLAGQALAPLPAFDGNYAVLGSWFAVGLPAGLSVREDCGGITKNSSRFVPHAIVG
jgi:glutathionylspermidine synthase